jgi:SAM-dependent methyltransferase
MAAMNVPPPSTCRVCGSVAEPAGKRFSSFSKRSFALAHCSSCRYSFVVHPRTDFAAIYDADYYAGRGADPHVSYTTAVRDGGSVLEYEWRGVVKILTDLGGLRPGSRWLDYGCGLGGLLRFGRSLGYDVSGFDQGWAAEVLTKEGLPVLTANELDSAAGSFDVVTAIEVVEHVLEPVEVFDRLAELLRPGGLLFLTTGNAKPYRGRLSRWQYVRPDIHVSFYEPETLEFCMRKAGLDPMQSGYRSGFTDLIRSKILRTVGVNRQNLVERCLPWALLSRVADRRFQVTRQPVAWRPLEGLRDQATN